MRHIANTKKSNFHYGLNLKKSFLLLFTIFSIVIPIGIQPQLQTIEAFDESVINDNISGRRDHNNGNGNNNDDIIDDDTDRNKNKDDSNDFPALGTNLQDRLNSVENDDIAINHDDLDITSKSNSNPNSLSNSSPAYDSLSSASSNNVYADSNNGNTNESSSNNIVLPDDRPVTKLSSTDSQMITANSNIKLNLNTNNDVTIIAPDNESSTELSSTASSSSQVSAQSSNEVYGDFNDDGKDDLAIGVPFEDVDTGSTINDAGAVNILYGSSNGLSATSPRSDQFWTQSTTDVNGVSEQGDNFGSSLTSGDFNGDGKDDLAIGVPGENGGLTGAGAVNILYGSSNGLSATSPRPDQFWTQDNPDVNGVSEQGDNFGSSLTSGDFNGDGKDDLAIGVPGEDVNIGFSISGAGAVNILYGSSNGLSATSPRPDQIWTQNSPDVNDLPEQGDSFGRSLSSGDFNGDGKDDLAIGVLFEDVDTGSTIDDAGAVNVIYGSSTGLSATSPRPDQFWTQSTTDVNDVSEESDDFSFSLTSGDFNGDGKDDLAIGSREEDIVNSGAEDIFDAGAVNVIYGSSTGLSATSPRPDQFWTQSTTDVNDVSEDDDEFGSSLTSGDFNGDGFDDLAIGVPDEDVETVFTIDDAGAVNILYGSSNGLSATSPRPDQFWTQDNLDVNDVSEQGDNFGSSLTSGDFNGDGKDDLAIGVPLEDAGTGQFTIVNTGAINVIYGSSNGLSATSPRPDQIWTQSTTDVNDVSETDDNFGSALA